MITAKGKSFAAILHEILVEQRSMRREIGQLRSEVSVLHKRPDELVNVDEAAALLGITAKTLRNRISAGEFPRPDQKLPNGGRKRKGWMMRTTLEHKLDG